MSTRRSLRLKPRTFLARLAIRVAERWLDRTLLPIDFPPETSAPRYGHGRPPHVRLAKILARDEDAYRAALETILAHRDDLLAIPAGPGEDGACWRNRWLPGLDAAALYSFVRARSPRRYFEIGSGISTLFARRAIDDGGLETRITSIDPHPRVPAADSASHRVVRQPLEAAHLELFADLGDGDVLFMDGSHRVLTNSDATVFFLDVLPELPAGVLVGLHDVLLPDDYLPEWEDQHWSEQYLMAAYLLAEGKKIRMELAASWVTSHSELCGLLAPLWDSPGMEGVDSRGFALWFTTANR